MTPVGCSARENWAPAPFGCGCGCRICRSQIDDLADRSLSAALAHAQNRAEAAGLGRFGDELTIDRDISVIWGPRRNLQSWLNNPTGRPGDTLPNRAGQWLYKIFLGSESKPLYLGRVTGR